MAHASRLPLTNRLIIAAGIGRRPAGALSFPPLKRIRVGDPADLNCGCFRQLVGVPLSRRMIEPLLPPLPDAVAAHHLHGPHHSAKNPPALADATMRCQPSKAAPCHIALVHSAQVNPCDNCRIGRSTPVAHKSFGCASRTGGQPHQQPLYSIAFDRI